MVLHRRTLILQLISFIAVAISAVAIADEALPPSQALARCPEHCGNITVPYPFGIGEGCYLKEEFSLTCNESTQPPTLSWRNGGIITTNLSVAEGELQILSYIAYDCYNKLGNQTKSNSPSLQVVPPYTISGTRNKFIAVGYDTAALFEGYRTYPNDTTPYIRGCVSLGGSVDDTTSAANDSCSGIGCCQTPIPSGFVNHTIELTSFYNHTSVWGFYPCSYAFIVEEGKFTFNSSTSFQQLNDTEFLPLILNFEIADGPCAKAENSTGYACKAINSECVNRTIDNTDPSGYYCRCSPGYEGNPYLPNGCRNTNECNSLADPCKNGICVDTVGDYNCTCNKGFIRNEEDPKSCIPDTSVSKNTTSVSKNTTLKVSLGICLSLLGIVLLTFWLYCGLKRRKYKLLKDKYFQQNGGYLLQQKLKTLVGHEAATIFTNEELKKATNNFHHSNKIGEGGYGFVYKGTQSNGNMIAIKVSRSSAPMAESNQFINEVIVLSQIKHKNVVKLLGCCLETQMPILVYEFINNGTLYEHIHKKNRKGPLSFRVRMKIAAETAGSLAYLHYSTSMQIVHRDVKATNILLDENYTAKVSDFGASKLVPAEDQNNPSTLVQGTLGYLDPEYLQSNILTEKSDVYSFGVVLVELITSQVAISPKRPEAERNLAKLFVTYVKENRLDQILDHEIINEGSFEIAKQVAYLAKRCLSVKGSERPTMKEVATELEGILQVMAKHPWGMADATSKETNYLLAPPSNAYAVDVRGDEGEIITSIDYEQSIQNQPQMMESYAGGR